MPSTATPTAAPFPPRMAVLPADAETRICCRCLARRPLVQFRRMRRGSDERNTECDRCHREKERARYHDRRRQGIATDAARIVREKNPERVRAACGEIIRRLGGVERFAELFLEALQHYQRNRPGSAVLLRMYGMVARMAEVSGEPAEGDDWSQVDDATLERITGLPIGPTAGEDRDGAGW